MTALEMFFYGVALFAALAALLQWSYRRSQNAARLRRGLREYVTAESSAEPEESLSTALEQS